MFFTTILNCESHHCSFNTGILMLFHGLKYSISLLNQKKVNFSFTDLFLNRKLLDITTGTCISPPGITIVETGKPLILELTQGIPIATTSYFFWHVCILRATEVGNKSKGLNTIITPKGYTLSCY